MNRRPEDQNGTELAKTYFDFFKHFATLGATAAVGIVTLRDVADISNLFVGLSLLGFGACLLASLRGMNQILLILESDPYMLESASVGHTINVARLVQGSFVTGVVVFVMGALGGLGAWYIVGPVAIMLYGFALWGRFFGSGGH